MLLLTRRVTEKRCDVAIAFRVRDPSRCDQKRVAAEIGKHSYRLRAAQMRHESSVVRVHPRQRIAADQRAFERVGKRRGFERRHFPEEGWPPCRGKFGDEEIPECRIVAPQHDRIANREQALTGRDGENLPHLPRDLFVFNRPHAPSIDRGCQAALRSARFTPNTETP